MAVAAVNTAAAATALAPSSNPAPPSPSLPSTPPSLASPVAVSSATATEVLHGASGHAAGGADASCCDTRLAGTDANGDDVSADDDAADTPSLATSLTTPTVEGVAGGESHRSTQIASFNISLLFALFDCCRSLLHAARFVPATSLAPAESGPDPENVPLSSAT
eukprot:4567527-Pleurochrysis_carterae.AAC.1